MKLARRRLTLALKPAKSAPCQICGSRSGFCVMITFVPPHWWGARRSTRRSK